MFSAIARTASCLVLVHIEIFIPVDRVLLKEISPMSRTLLDLIVKRTIKVMQLWKQQKKL
jgi:hypothetical protein